MIIPYLTPKQQQVPKLVYKFRFLNSTHIQKLMHHQGKRRINSWLKDLSLKGYIVRIDEDDSFLTIKEVDKPKVYRLGINGIRFIRMQIVNNQNMPTGQEFFDLKQLHKFYREKQRSREFIEHSLLLADIYLSLRDAQALDDELIFLTKSEYASPLSPLINLAGISPDAYIFKKTAQEKINQYLLNLIPESLLRSRSFLLRKKIRNYFYLYFSQEWEVKTHSTFPTLLFVLPDMRALISLQRYIQNRLNEMDNPNIPIWLTTQEKIQKLGFTNVNWEEVK